MNLARTAPASSVGSFIAFGLLSALLISLKFLFMRAAPGIWTHMLPSLIFYGLMGVAIYRCKALTIPRIVLFVAAMATLSALSGFSLQALMPQLSADHIKPQIIGSILSRLTWLESGIIALTTLVFFRGRSPIALVAAFMPGPLTAGVFAFLTITPQIAGFGLPNMKILQVISIFASQTIHAVALWVVVTNANRPIEPGFMSVTLKRPPDLHWIWVLLLSLLSAGGFGALWSIVQACWANGVDSSTTALRSCLGSTAIIVIIYVLITLAPFLPQGSVRAALMLIVYLLLILGAVTYWFGVLAIAATIETYARTVHSRDLRLNRFWVFLIAVPYLQFHLSRLAEDEPEYEPISAVFA